MSENPFQRDRAKHLITPVVSNAYYIGSKGHILVWECWRGLQTGECDYRRTL